MSRNIIVVGDDIITTLLTYTPLDIEVFQAFNLADLQEKSRNGQIPTDISGVIFTDMTSDTLQAIVSTIENVLLARISCAVIAYNRETLDVIERNYANLEASITKEHQEALQRKENLGQTFTDAERRNPLETTELILSSADAGVGGVMQALGPHLRNPIPETELARLGEKYFQPLPNPHIKKTAARQHQARIIAVVSDKGGCGKTSTSILLGSALAFHTSRTEPKSVVIVDLDRQSQMRGHYPNETRDITMLRADSSSDEVLSALHVVPEISGLRVLLGGQNTGEHLALRSVDLYENVLEHLATHFDVVILDCSVGTNSDDVTKWAQQQADDVFYILDQSAESIQLAAAAKQVALLPEAEGGLGIEPDRWSVIMNRVRDKQGDPYRDSFDESIDRQVGFDHVFAVIPDSHPEVSIAKDAGKLVELVRTSDQLAPVMLQIAKAIFPFIQDNTLSTPKRRLFGRK